MSERVFRNTVAFLLALLACALLWGDTFSPNDPYFVQHQQWALENTGTSRFGGVAGADIRARAAWQRATGEGVIVAVPDSGIVRTHEDLAPNIWTNPGEIPGNGIDDDGDGYIDDVHGWNWFKGNDDTSGGEDAHGTHVAGIIAARGNNGLGITGVAPFATIMPLSLLGYVASNTYANLSAAIDFAVAHGAQVINASWYDTVVAPEVYGAVSRANEAGVLVVAAAGQNGLDVDEPGVDRYPCEFDLPNVICVASTNAWDELATGSNWGAVSVDVAAPGQSIISTLPDSQSPDGYGEMGGASMATAQVSGVAALLLSCNPNLTASELKAVILSTARPLPSLDGKVATGGIVDADAATAAVCGTDPTPTNTPTSTPTFTATATATPKPTMTRTPTPMPPTEVPQITPPQRTATRTPTRLPCKWGKSWKCR